MKVGNDNEGGNIVPFPNRDEVIDNNPQQAVAKIWFYEDGSSKIWVSYSIDDGEKVEWLKLQAGESFTNLFNYLNGIDDGTDGWEGQIDDEEDD